MVTVAGVGVGVERRIIAAEIAMEDDLPAIARLFLSKIAPEALELSGRPCRDRFLRISRRSRRCIV